MLFCLVVRMGGRLSLGLSKFVLDFCKFALDLSKFVRVVYTGTWRLVFKSSFFFVGYRRFPDSDENFIEVGWVGWSKACQKSLHFLV